jgi:hypothetical protein
MKTLIALALLISVSVSSAAEFAIANKGGGQIRLTSVQCNESSLIAYAFTLEGYVSYGCWIIRNDLIHITWDTGDRRVYLASEFQPIGGK